MQYIHSYVGTIIIIGGCQSRESASPITKNVGESVQLYCLDNSPCQGTNYGYYHYSLHTEEFELVHQGSHKLTVDINTMDNAGEYYCIKECARNATPADQHRCYWNVIGKLHSHIATVQLQGCVMLHVV